MKTRIEDLRHEIADHDERYYRDANPIISDAEYDALKAELEALEEKHPELSAEDSPTQTIGDDRTKGFAKSAHITPMLSLDHVYGKAGLDDWLLNKRRETLFIVEPKIDGIAANFIYRGGKLAKVLTRGNGREGDDITRHAKNIIGVPFELEEVACDYFELRGEIYMSFEEFKRINAAREAAGEEPFANPRNLAAGTVKSLNPEATRERKLNAIFYGIGAGKEHFIGQDDLQSFFHVYKIPYAKPSEIVYRKELWRAIQEVGKKARPLFPIDGVVVKVDDFAEHKRLGEGCRVPKWALAVKFKSPEAETTLRAITLKKGKTGKITPVAEFDEIQLAGTKVSRANLCNRKTVEALDLRIGDKIVVEKTGEIIPKVVRVITPKSKHEQLPAFDYDAAESQV